MFHAYTIGIKEKRNNMGKFYLGSTGINEIKLGATNPYILDYFGADAEIAVSFRRLRSDYTGSVVQLKRTFDSATLDFGFASGSDYLDTGSVDAWCSAGGGACSISKWYNQASGSSHGDLNGGTYQPSFGNLTDKTNFRSANFNSADDGLAFTDNGVPAVSQSTEYLVAEDTEGGVNIVNIFTLASSTGTSPMGLKLENNGGTGKGEMSINPSASSVVEFDNTFPSSSQTFISVIQTDGSVVNAQWNTNITSSAYTGGTPTGNMKQYGYLALTDYSSGNHAEYIRWNKTIDNPTNIAYYVNQYYNLY